VKPSLEAQRILDRYRRLILLGRVELPLAEATRLLGPDRAYHLYFRSVSNPRPSRPRRCKRRR
jgi:hypothetical protein